MTSPVESAQSVKDKIRNLLKNKPEIDFNTALRFYMYDRFIERLSKSEYWDNFILKGGFYLSRYFGITNRSTIDIDTLVRNTNLDIANIREIFSEIFAIDLGDNIEFNIEAIEPIRDEDEYGGIRVVTSFRLGEIKDRFHIDIATGDPIYPGPLNFGYKSLVGDETYHVLAYSLETVLAEKLETILSRAEANTRMKDYYDVYLIHKLGSINPKDFKIAATKTFREREFKGDPKQLLRVIKTSGILAGYWQQYAKKNTYAQNLSFSQMLEALQWLIGLL